MCFSTYHPASISTKPPEEEDDDKTDGEHSYKPTHGLCPPGIRVVLAIGGRFIEDAVEYDGNLQRTRGNTEIMN